VTDDLLPAREFCVGGRVVEAADQLRCSCQGRVAERSVELGWHFAGEIIEHLAALLVGAEIARCDLEMECGEMREQRTDELAVRLRRSAHGVRDADDALGDPSTAETYFVHGHIFAWSARRS
jgi:hypothetical protein